MYQRGIFIGLTLLLACARLNAGEASEGDAFSFVIDEPHVRVTIPGLPMLSMNPHPLGDEDPQFRLLGTAKGVSVAAIAPLAEKGITAVECASAIANSILEHRKIGADRQQDTFGAFVFSHVLDTKMSQRRRSAGEIASSVREFESVRDFFTSASLTSAIDLLFIGVFLAVLWVIVGPPGKRR